MLWLADENFDGRIVSGLRNEKPTIDIVRAQDSEIRGADDVALLEWAAAHRRILLSHDVNTLVGFAHDRLRRNQLLTGLVECHRYVPIGIAIQDILTIEECSQPEEWEGQVVYLPL